MAQKEEQESKVNHVRPQWNSSKSTLFSCCIELFNDLSSDRCERHGQHWERHPDDVASGQLIRNGGSSVSSEHVRRQEQAEQRDDQSSGQERQRPRRVVLSPGVGEQPSTQGCKERRTVQLVRFKIHGVNAGQQQNPG